MGKVLSYVTRSLGYDIRRYSPSRSPAVQLAKALEMAAIDLVFDVGANEGQFAQGIRRHGYTGRIVSFEPLSSARQSLLRTSSKDLSWSVHEQSAVGDQTGTVILNVAGNSVSSSVLPMLESHSDASQGSAYIGAERVPVTTLDSVTSLYLRPENNLFLKIDTQGFEWQVLDGARHTLGQVRGVLCELSLVPLYEGQHLWRDIVDRLESSGFYLWALQQGFTDPQTGQSLQMDGIFLKREVVHR